ncbi:Cell division protein ZipA [compost metagenome]
MEPESEKAEPELSLNPNIETAEIAEFEGESNILDVHLHEQQRYDDESALAMAEQIIALNVYPNPRRALSGDKALKVLLKYGLRYGEMSCFHRYENTDEPSVLMFSVLRMTDNGPAGFDLETLSTEQVQGLAFFLALPNSKAVTGFDMMASIAGLIAREIDGKVYDENNLEFTPQLKEHWRHHVIDYRPAQATA